jgi:hypothetical protein
MFIVRHKRSNRKSANKPWHFSSFVVELLCCVSDLLTDLAHAGFAWKD